MADSRQFGRTWEIMGIAGSGKSTLVNGAVKIRNGERHRPLQKREMLTLIARSALRQFPRWKELREAGWKTRQHLDTVLKWGCPTDFQLLRLLIQLDVRARSWTWNRQRVCYFDQGPMYLLTRLAVYGFVPPGTTQRDWWKEMVDCWSQLLDGLIVLQVPPEVARRRIVERSKDHVIKRVTVSQQLHFLTRYQAAIDEVVALFEARRGEKAVVTIATDVLDSNEAIEKMVQCCQPPKNGEVKT